MVEGPCSCVVGMGNENVANSANFLSDPRHPFRRERRGTGVFMANPAPIGPTCRQARTAARTAASSSPRTQCRPCLRARIAPAHKSGKPFRVRTASTTRIPIARHSGEPKLRFKSPRLGYRVPADVVPVLEKEDGDAGLGMGTHHRVGGIAVDRGYLRPSLKGASTPADGGRPSARAFRHWPAGRRPLG